MTPLTEDQKLARTKRRMIYVKAGGAIAVIFLIFFAYQGCQKSKNTQLAYNEIKDSLKKVLADTARIQEKNRMLEYENKDLDLHIADLVADLQLTKGALIDESDKTLRLSNEVKKAKATHDTVKYYLHCDSLAEENSNLRNWLEEGWAYETKRDSLQDAQLKNMQTQRDNFESAYNDCKKAVKFTVAELPQIKPKGRMIANVGGIISGPIWGVGGGLQYIFENGLSIRADVMATNHGLISIGSIGVPLK